ncbi:MAG: hypothetical protein WA764_24105, partial [Pseudolabrys sp.]
VVLLVRGYITMPAAPGLKLSGPSLLEAQSGVAQRQDEREPSSVGHTRTPKPGNLTSKTS